MAVGEAPRAVDELGRVEPQPQLGTTIKGTAIKGGLRALEAGADGTGGRLQPDLIWLIWLSDRV